VSAPDVSPRESLLDELEQALREPCEPQDRMYARVMLAELRSLLLRVESPPPAGPVTVMLTLRWAPAPGSAYPGGREVITGHRVDHLLDDEIERIVRGDLLRQFLRDIRAEGVPSA
jgi:hypothetical protein